MFISIILLIDAFTHIHFLLQSMQRNVKKSVIFRYIVMNIYTNVSKNIFNDCKYTVTLANSYNCNIQMRPAWFLYFWSLFTKWFSRTVTIMSPLKPTEFFIDIHSCSVEYCVIFHDKYLFSFCKFHFCELRFISQSWGMIV